MILARPIEHDHQRAGGSRRFSGGRRRVCSAVGHGGFGLSRIEF